MTVPQATVFGLTKPSADDGPVKLLACTVSPSGVLEAQVDNQSDDVVVCNIQCNYELADRMFSHTFNESIPKRYHGRIGQFDTNGARAGTYSGTIGNCKKASRGVP